MSQVAASFSTLLKESLFGRFVHAVSGGKVFNLPCENADYPIAAKYLGTANGTDGSNTTANSAASLKLSANVSPEAQNEGEVTAAPTITDGKETDGKEAQSEKAESVSSGERSSSPTASELYSRDKIIVTWDGDDDPMNPLNWPTLKKVIIILIISLCTTSLYMGAAIFTPAEEDLRSEFHTSRVKVMLGLTLFVWGYGIGSLWFSPMSENPRFGGRNYIYLFTQLVFAALQIPTALVNHIGSFAVLRLLGGIMASPCLSTGGASFADFVKVEYLPLAILTWALGAICGPFIAPLVGGALVQEEGSRYPIWFMLGISAGMFVVMFFFLPETSSTALLMRKAAHLRKVTGNELILAPGDITLRTQTTKQVLKHIFWLPMELTAKEPVLLLMNIHIGLVYSVMYLYFEAYPLAYGGVYGFNLVQQGLAYLSLLVGALICAVLYVFYLGQRVKKITSVEQLFGPSAIFASVCFPIGMLIFGWTVSPNIHWIVSMVGNAFFAGGAFILFQSYFGFIGTLYVPEVSGSAFASNNIIRSLMAGAFPLFGTVMFQHLSIDKFEVGWGCTILALFALGLLPLPIYLLLKGTELRQKALEKYGSKGKRL